MKLFSIPFLAMVLVVSHSQVVFAQQNDRASLGRPLPLSPQRSDTTLATAPARPTTPLPSASNGNKIKNSGQSPISRNNYDCAKCTKKTCLDARTMSDCIQQCDAAKISDCANAPLKIKSETDANYAGSIASKRFLNKLYKDYPSISYMLIQSGSSQINSQTMLDNVKRRNLISALREVDKACQAVTVEISEVSKKKKVDNLNAVKALQSNMTSLHGDLVKKISSIQVNINRQKSTVPQIKTEIDDAMLLSKNCFNQGSVVKYQVENTDFMAEEKKKCMTSCTEARCKNASIYKNCLKDCSQSLLKKCIAAAKVCPGNGSKDAKTCGSTHNKYMKDQAQPSS